MRFPSEAIKEIAHQKQKGKSKKTARLFSMGIMGIKIKIMPTSLEANLNGIKKEVKNLVEKKGGKNREYLEEPIAFGLKAIIAFFEWPEEKELEPLEEQIKKIKNVSSIQIIDMRRLVG